MLGALVACLGAVLAGVSLRSPERIRPFVIAILGVMLGSSFSVDLLTQVGPWLASLAGLLVYMVVAAAVVVPLYRRMGGMDRPTAFFSAMPGGIAEMVLIGGAMGGDERRIVLSHAARIVTTIALIAVWFRGVAGFDVGTSPQIAGALDVQEIVVLTLCGVAGAYLGVLVRLPAPMLLGPMILSALAHIGGIAEASPPAALVSAAQIVLGTAMGCRFIGATPGMVVRALGLSMIATALVSAASSPKGSQTSFATMHSATGF